MANPQVPDEEFSHQPQVRPNVPAAKAIQPLITVSEKVNSKTCQAETSPWPGKALVPNSHPHEKRGEGVVVPPGSSSSALIHSAHFPLERLSGACTGINFSLS